MSSLAWTGLLMGLAGGPHCLAMCGAACAALARGGAGAAASASALAARQALATTGRASIPIQPLPVAAAAPGQATASDTPSASPWPSRRDALFQVGRLLGYSLTGAAAALAVDSLAWLSAQTVLLRPVWTLFHVMVLVWGGVLLVNAQQPLWVQGAARSVWQHVQGLTRRQSGVFATGMLWTLMPCGLLYSALLVAGLSGSVLDGAGVMASFALGSSVSLLLGPWLWRGLQRHVNAWRQDWGSRAAGLLLCGLAGWALWMDMAHRIADWCR
ncbi:sulfite exporter TauE/SafE family protein [Curvibacter sp. HBC61]|uniref:Sulfite exporter TauE/SafE family protein n=1 Tax=Curvibacter cyanobacteriorum TaxID=3026422 RepID=A0ABT5MZW4_9BURK|nr:sulfite exporter TauE/SafE family protein [Curvibacter sp. HBC61]MDD0838806.1 sulfite exporter TauE/SafE family protein [Curvibacter sp. HBC61]